MTFVKKKNLILFSILSLLIIAVLLSNQMEKDSIKAKEPIVINLLTNVHPNLPWRFKSLSKKISVQPGEVTTIEYEVENLKNVETSGIATFSYFPKQFGNYIRKLNCFCYDAKTLKAKQQDKYSVVILIDPEVTKDSDTKDIKEVTIQFIFFDYKDYKESNS
jgi:cytochrome c oxidase assembly protein subunit 11